jgi:hypothetical protein
MSQITQEGHPTLYGEQARRTLLSLQALINVVVLASKFSPCGR